MARKPWFDSRQQKELPIRVNDLFTANGVTWVGTDKGLVIWERHTAKWRLAGKQKYENCSFVSWNKNYLILSVIDQGLFLYNKKTEAYTSLPLKALDGSIISNNSIQELYLDSDENLWISFLNSGLIYANLRKTKFKSLPIFQTPGMEKKSYNYWCLWEDKAENLWYGTTNNGLFRFDEKGNFLAHFQQDEGNSYALPNEWVTGIQHGEEGNFLISTRSGIALLNPESKKMRLVATDNGEVGHDFPFLLQLKNGDLLASSKDEGIFRLVNRNGKYVLRNIWASGTDYNSMFEDQSGHIYTSRNDVEVEVFQMVEDTLNLLYTLPLRGIVTDYFEEEDGKTLWISSFSGLAKINIATQQIDSIYTERDGLPTKNIHALLADDSQNLWLSTPSGLVFFDKEKQQFKSFSLTDGTQSSEFHIGAALKRKNGQLWFGGNNGITIIEPEKISYLKQPPKVQITGILINDEKTDNLHCENTEVSNISQIKKLDCKYNENTISFEFVAIDYSDPQTTQLKYKLEGRDKQWVELAKGEPGFARYSSLRENTYRFLVKGANSDGEWGEAEEMMTICILPPFQRTWEFRLLMLCLLGGIGYMWYRYRINQIREKAELNTRVAENKMSALRAQMNPHFVFNSLQTLNGLIVRKEMRDAIEYVSQFAKLMRMILENSRVGSISLEKEIELLELYIKVEARRFKTPFTYKIRVAKEVDTYSIEIPSMLLQPFVENAIKHGLFHKQGQGHIDIAFIRENGLLQCVVEDDGIGRIKSAELNAQQGRQHKSRGLEIVKERLNIIKAYNPGDYDIQVVDLYDRNQHPTGTRVEIFLPIKN